MFSNPRERGISIVLLVATILVATGLITISSVEMGLGNPVLAVVI
jgi:hypothetical protein